MQIIKPLKLGLIHRALCLRGQHELCVSPIIWFSLSKPEQLLSEQEGWKKIMQSLRVGEVFDVGIPKNKTDVLLSGKAYAPDTNGIDCLSVSLSVQGLESLQKELLVYGDQDWVLTEDGWSKTRVKPFHELDLTWENAFGGEGFAVNPVGKGFLDQTKELARGCKLPIPNLRASKHQFQQVNEPAEPIGLGPIDVSSPIRQQRAGTYDEQWLIDGHLGLAADHDPAIHNFAQDDQWIDGCLKGDEFFELRGVKAGGEIISGKLPAMTSRVFIQRKDAIPTQLEEIETVIDTVWFFPEHDMGVLIYRGRTEITDSDALDIEALMLAYERANDERRPLSYYQQVYRLRTNKETALASIMHDSQLTPEKTMEQLIQQQTEYQRAEQIQQLRIDSNQRKILDKIKNSTKEYSFDMSRLIQTETDKKSLLKDEEGKKITQPRVPVIPKEAIERGDVDLTETMGAINKLIEQNKKQAADLARELETALAQEPMKSHGSDANDQKRTLAEVRSELDARFSNASKGDDIGIDPKVSESLDQLKKQMRLLSPTDTTKSSELDHDARQHLRDKVVSLLKSGKSLQGLDLSGANLQGLDFSNMNLTSVMLESANLADCCFKGAILDKAVLTNATLDNSTFDQASFGEASLSAVSAARTCFKRVKFAQQTITRAHFVECDFSGAEFDSIAFIESRFDDCKLQDSRCNKVQIIKTAMPLANWQRSTFTQTLMVEVKLSGADFSDAKFVRTIFAQFDAKDANFSNGFFDRVQFAGDSSLLGANFTNIYGGTVGMQGLNLTGSRFQKAVLKEVNFGYCDFSETDLRDAGFLKCVFSNTKMEKVRAVNTNFTESLMRKSNWKASNLYKANFFAVNAKESMFENCNLDYVENMPAYIEVRP